MGDNNSNDNLTNIYDKKDEEDISKIIEMLEAKRPDMYKDEEAIANVRETLKIASRLVHQIVREIRIKGCDDFSNKDD